MLATLVTGLQVSGSQAATMSGAVGPALLAAPSPTRAVMLVVDTSGSMAGAPLTQAKAALTASIDGLTPTDRAGLRSYGGECGEGGSVLVPPATGNRDELRDAVAGLGAGGNTPTPDALRSAAADFPADAAEKLLVLVSDGQSTCGDPCPVASELKQQLGIGFQAFTVGFNAPDQAAGELACIARVTGGQYFPADDTQSLQDAIDAALGGGGGAALPDSALYGTGNASSNAPVACAGDPVNCVTGNFSLDATDVEVGGRGPALEFGRTYNSLDADRAGPLGRGWSGSFTAALAVDPDSGKVTVRQENGGEIAFAPTAGGYAAPTWGLATLEHLPSGDWRFTRREREIMTFDADGRLSTVADLNGETTRLVYQDGRLTQIVAASGRRLLVGTDPAGRIVRITAPGRRTTQFAYDDQGRLTGVTDPRGGVLRYAYGADHRMTSWRDPSGAATANTYDADGRVVTQTDAAGAVTKWDYEITGGAGTTRITAADGQVVEETFTGNLLQARTVAAGTASATTTRFTYAPGSLGLASVVDPLGHITRYGYDERGNVDEVVLADGARTTSTYDDLNNVLTVTDAAGVTTGYTYDAAGNALTESVPTGAGPAVTTYARSSEHPGEVVSAADPEGRVTKLGYSPAGDLATVRDGGGALTRMTYDAAGDLVRTVDAKGRSTSLRRDALGRVDQVTDPTGATTRSEFDPVGRLVALVDQRGARTTMSYDAVGRATGGVRPDGTAVSSRYDAVGRLVAEVDANGRQTTHEYDPRGLPVRTTVPGGLTSGLGYDAAGRLTSVTDSAGRTVRMSYSDRGLLTEVDHQDATPDVSFRYDTVGRRTSMRDGSGESTYAYDSAGRLTSTRNGAGQVLGTEYDRSGLAVKKIYPNGAVVEQGYDAVGRLATVTDWRDKEFTFRYSATGALERQVAPNGVTTGYTHDLDDAVIGTEVAAANHTLSWTGNARDRQGLLVAEVGVGSGTDALLKTFGYDAMGQMTSATTGLQRTSYAYDRAGELTGLRDGARGATLTRSASGAATSLGLTSSGRPAGTTAYGVDAVGNRTTATSGQVGATYGWDAAGNLTSYAGPTGGAGLGSLEQSLLGAAAPGASVTAGYTYDGDGLRATRTVAGRTATFLYDSSAEVPQLLAEGARYYVTGPDGRVLEQVDTEAGDSALYLQADQLGSTRLLTDERGRPVQTFAYTPYGQLRGPPAAPRTSILFAGGYRDTESGLYYLVNRYYDPATAQFMSVDPLLEMSGSAYGYAGNSPANFTDPLGLCWGPGCWVQDHWRGIATTAVVVVGTGAAIACTVATVGICGGVIATAVTVAGIGAATSAAAYALEDTCHTGGGFLAAGVIGAIPIPGPKGTGGVVGKAFHSYVDITVGKSVRNIATDATHTEFAQTLISSGWKQTTSQNGAVQIFQKDGAKYVLRSQAKSYDGWNADFTPAGVDKVTLKIRLGYAP